VVSEKEQVRRGSTHQRRRGIVKNYRVLGDIQQLGDDDQRCLQRIDEITDMTEKKIDGG